MKPSLLILSAGIGSRYGGLHQLDPVGPSGETILDYSIFDAVRAGFGRVVFVIRREMEQAFRERIGLKPVAADFAFQEMENIPAPFKPPAERAKPWGTAHAILSAADQLHGPFAVINADDFYGAEAFRALARHLSGDAAPHSPTASARVPSPRQRRRIPLLYFLSGRAQPPQQRRHAEPGLRRCHLSTDRQGARTS